MSSDNFKTFVNFTFVFTGIFLLMTVIILQVVQNGTYKSVDKALNKSAIDITHFAEEAYRRNLYTVGKSEEDPEDGKGLKSSPTDLTKSAARSIAPNMDILLFDKDSNLLNEESLEAYSTAVHLSLDKTVLDTIHQKMILISNLGRFDAYRFLSVELNSSLYPDIAYATIAVNVSQYVENSQHTRERIIQVMLVFWGISVLSSVYLARWSRQPIVASYERQKTFVENASHELRTPLAVLQNRLEVLFRKPNSTILDNYEGIAASLEEVRNMKLLTTNLLNLARRDDGIDVVVIAISPSFFDTIFDNYHLVAQESGKIFEGNNRLNEMIYLDETLLKQLMTILFDNAVKYTNQYGEIMMTARMDNKHSLYISVADNGPGIADEDKDKIFERFYRVDKARTRQIGGFGLGLSMAKQIVEAMSGTITVKDGIPKGTIFEVKFDKVTKKP